MTVFSSEQEPTNMMKNKMNNIINKNNHFQNAKNKKI